MKMHWEPADRAIVTDIAKRSAAVCNKEFAGEKLNPRFYAEAMLDSCVTGFVIGGKIPIEDIHQMVDEIYASLLTEGTTIAGIGSRGQVEELYTVQKGDKNVN